MWGLCEPCHHCHVGSSTQNKVEEAIQGTGSSGDGMVPAGYVEANHPFVYVINIHMCKGCLEPIQVGKELLFSDRCIISLVVLLTSVCNARALPFLENGFPSDRYLGEACSPREAISPMTWSLVGWQPSPGGVVHGLTVSQGTELLLITRWHLLPTNRKLGLGNRG